MVALRIPLAVSKRSGQFFAAAICCLLLPGTGWAHGQAAAAKDSPASVPSELFEPGIVIERFYSDSSGAKQAGLQEGDVLLAWSRGEAGGTLETPFDLSLALTEQQPRGSITYAGLRGSQSRQWTVNKFYWGARTRPNFAAAALLAYREATKMAEAGDYHAAVQRWRAGVTDAQRLRFPWVDPWFLRDIAALLVKTQHWKEADNVYEQAVSQSAPSPSAARAQLLLEWGYQLYQRSELERAEECLKQALQDIPDPDTSNLAADVFQYLSIVTLGRGNLSESQMYSVRNAEIRQKLEPGSMPAAVADANLANTFEERGDFAEAEKHYRRTLATFEQRAPHSVGKAYLLNNLGEVAQKRGDLEKAERYARAAETLIGEIDPNTSGQALILNELASILTDQGKLREAEECLRRSMAVLEKVAPGGQEVASVRQSLGDLACRKGNFQGAEPDYLEALAIREKLAPQGLDTAETLHSLGSVALRRGELARAKSYNEKALAIQEPLAPKSSRQAATLAALAEISRREGHLDEAASYYERALSSLEGQVGQLGGSNEVQAAFRAKHGDYYRGYIDLLISQNKTEQALDVLERSRARMLLENLAGAGIDIRKGVDHELIEKERSLLADLKAKSELRLHSLSEGHSMAETKRVEREMNSLSNDLQDLEAQIRSSSPAYAALIRPQPLRGREIQRQLLDSDTVLLEYSLGEERSHVFLVSSDSLQVFEFPKREVAEKAARRVYQLLTERTRRDRRETYRQRAARIAQAEAEYPTAALRLSQMVLGPVAAKLENKRLLIVSDGALQYLPFAALPLPRSRQSPAPLITKHEVVNLPSASVLAVLRRERQERKSASKAVAVFADPVFDPRDARVKNAVANMPAKNSENARRADEKQELMSEAAPSFSLENVTRSAADVGWMPGGRGDVYLPRLPFTRREAKEIVAVTPSGQSFAALDFNASRASAMNRELRNYRVVHFATHALIDNRHPELSGLVLSLVDRQGKPHDGFLDLQDIYNLDLNADLVVLSACETALGKEMGSEGLIGITRGFMYAGTPSVMASLWAVDDFATATLMKSFYKSIEENGRRPAAALRHAQLQLWKQKRWSAPFYWGGFILQGDRK
jgi:CHAT domain-containing protein/Tfp pilus assembly protein PilF